VNRFLPGKTKAAPEAPQKNPVWQEEERLG
jgi:hypothetical protein